MSFSTSVCFPRDLVMFLCICNHVPSHPFIIHIKQDMEKYNNSNLFDSQQHCLLWNQYVHHFYPGVRAVSACVGDIGHNGIKICNVPVLTSSNVVNKCWSKWTAQSVGFHLLPAGLVQVGGDSLGTRTCVPYSLFHP
jgi:hypothetical protein